MNKHSSLGTSGSLIERAAEMFDFRSQVQSPLPDQPDAAVPAAEAPAKAVAQPRPPKRPLVLSQADDDIEAPVAADAGQAEVDGEAEVQLAPQSAPISHSSVQH